MLEYFVVQEAPENLKTNEMVIVKPNFMEEVVATRPRRGIIPAATIRSIRDILMVITDKYDNTINPYHLKLQNYDNMLYTGDKGFSDLICKIIKDLDLPLVEKAVELKLKARKGIIDTVYYVSDDLDGAGAFLKLGFQMGDAKNKKKTINKDNVV